MFSRNVSPADRSEAGFSLFESLIALAVFSLAALSTLTLITQNLRSVSEVEARTMAGFVAENVLVDTNLRLRIDLGQSEGEARMGGYEFVWQRDILPTGEGDLNSVVVRVRQKGRDRVLIVRNGFRKG
ncbi:MAG: type II secretion system protein GspI [Ponticaulis sp.]|nr:type II secretion system protein GspI [Ponticaulis sp.]